MSISIRAAFKNVASENYNKTNLFYYIILIILCGICGLFVPEENAKTFNYATASAFLFYLIICFVMSGIYIVSINNAIYNKDGIIPNLFSDILKIIAKGFANLVGCFTVSLIMMIIIAVPFVILLAIMPLLGLLVIPVIFILGVYFLGLYFNFVISLELADWFNLRKASEFIKKSGGKLGVYILKFLIINIICFILALAVVLPISIMFGLQAVFSSAALETLKITTSSICSLIASVIFGIGNIYTIDLTAQFIKEIDFRVQDINTEIQEQV